MIRTALLIALSFVLYSGAVFSERSIPYPGSRPDEITKQDTTDIQLLLNGKVWRNLYGNIKSDPYLFSASFAKGTITANGKTWHNRDVRYDIYNDELETTGARGIIVQLNKEMVSAFSMNYGNGIYRFVRLDRDSLNNIEGYVNALYQGAVSLYVRYSKKIQVLAVNHEYDIFEQSYKIFLMKDGKMYQVRNKRDVITLFGNYEAEIKNYIRSKKMRVTKSVPRSFIPLVEFCDKLGQ